MTAKRSKSHKSAKSRKSGLKVNRKRTRQALAFGLPVLAVILIAAAVYVLTARYLLPQDNLARLVPADAVSYLHYNLDNPNAKAGETLDLPGGLTPNEAARFTLADGGLAATNGTATDLKTGWLVSWRVGQPSEENQKRLASLQAVQSWKNVWLIGDRSLQVKLDAAVRTGDSLADDPVSADALSAARSLSPLQFIFNSVALPASSQNGPPASLSKSLPPIAGAAADLSLTDATIFPLERSASLLDVGSSLFEPEAPPLYWPAGADFAYAGTGRTANWVPLIFRRVNDWRRRSGLDSVSLPYPQDIHDGPLTMTVMPPAKPGQEPTLIIHLIGADLTQVSSRISHYLDTAMPHLVTTSLPDGDKVDELTLKPGINIFTAPSQGNTELVWSNQSADMKIYLKSDFDGVVLSNQPVEQLPTQKISLISNKCDGVEGNKLIMSGLILNEVWKIIGLPANSQDEFRLFIENNAKLWITCRLLPNSVDK